MCPALQKNFQPLLPAPPTSFFQKRLVKASVNASKGAKRTAGSRGRDGTQRSWEEAKPPARRGVSHEVNSSKEESVRPPPSGAPRAAGNPEGQKKTPFVAEELFDKRPDIMGPIPPPLDQPKEHPNAIHGTAARRRDVKTWGAKRYKLGEENPREIHVFQKRFETNFPSWRWGEG